jgi:hypothetical protein
MAKGFHEGKNILDGGYRSKQYPPAASFWTTFYGQDGRRLGCLRPVGRRLTRWTCGLASEYCWRSSRWWLL